MLPQNVVILAAVITALGSVNYLIDTIKGKVKPNRVSYGMWALASLIAFAAEIYQGVGIHALLTFSVGFWPLAILVASFLSKKAHWKLTAFDFACGAFSLIGLGLWAITKQGNIAIFFSIIADTFAAIPTVVKSYRHPETETPLTYATSAAGAALTLLTIKSWNFAHFGYPLYIFIINLIVTSLIFFKVGKQSKHAN